MASPAPRKNKPLTGTWARACLARGSSAGKAWGCRQAASGAGAAVCPGNSTGQQLLGLYGQGTSLEIQGRDHFLRSVLRRPHLDT